MNTVFERLTMKLAEVILPRLEKDARFPVSPHAGARVQVEHDELAALLLAARQEPNAAADLFAGEPPADGAPEGSTTSHELRDAEVARLRDDVDRWVRNWRWICDKLRVAEAARDVAQGRPEPQIPTYEQLADQFGGEDKIPSGAMYRRGGRVIDIVREDTHQIDALIPDALRLRAMDAAKDLPSTPHAEAVRSAFPTTAAKYERAAQIVRDLAKLP